MTDGRIELDSNAVERTIRPIALNRKNAIFAGHDAGAQNWAMTAIAQGHRQSDIEALLPWDYKDLTGRAGHEHHRIEDYA